MLKRDTKTLPWQHTAPTSLHMSYCCEIWGSTYQSRLKKLFLLQKNAIWIIYNLNYHDHTSVFFHSSKILKLHYLVTFRTMIILCKANNHSLNGRFKHTLNQPKLYTCMVPDKANCFMLKKQTPPSDYCHSLSKV